MTTPDPPPNHSATWYAIVRSQFGDLHGWPMVQAATHIADQAIKSLTNSAATDQDQTRSRLAAMAYHQLREYDAIAHPPTHPSMGPARCILDRDDIRTWLSRPAYAGAHNSTAQRLHVDDSFRADVQHFPARLSRLVVAAQDDGVFGVADHEIRLWHVADQDVHDDGYLITIQPPLGPQLAYGNLAAAELLGRDSQGIDAATNALTTIGRHVNVVLAGQAGLLQSVRAALSVAVDSPQRPSSVHRAFATPLTQNGPMPSVAPAPPDHPTTTSHRSR